jgi:hypothetical protein
MWTRRVYRNPMHLEKVLQHPDGSIEIVLNPIFSDPVVLKYVPFWGTDELQWDLEAPEHTVVGEQWPGVLFHRPLQPGDYVLTPEGVFLAEDVDKEGFHIPDSDDLPDRGKGTLESAVLDAMEAKKAKTPLPDHMKNVTVEGGTVKFDCITTAPDIEVALGSAVFSLQDSGLYSVEMVLNEKGQDLVKAIAQRHTTGSFMIRPESDEPPVVGVLDQSSYEMSPMGDGLILEAIAQVSFVD